MNRPNFSFRSCSSEQSLATRGWVTILRAQDMESWWLNLPASSAWYPTRSREVKQGSCSLCQWMIFSFRWYRAALARSIWSFLNKENEQKFTSLSPFHDCYPAGNMLVQFISVAWRSHEWGFESNPITWKESVTHRDSWPLRPRTTDDTSINILISHFHGMGASPFLMFRGKKIKFDDSFILLLVFKTDHITSF